MSIDLDLRDLFSKAPRAASSAAGQHDQPRAPAVEPAPGQPEVV